MLPNEPWQLVVGNPGRSGHDLSLRELSGADSIQQKTGERRKSAENAVATPSQPARPKEPGRLGGVLPQQARQHTVRRRPSWGDAQAANAAKGRGSQRRAEGNTAAAAAECTAGKLTGSRERREQHGREAPCAAGSSTPSAGPYTEPPVDSRLPASTAESTSVTDAASSGCYPGGSVEASANRAALQKPGPRGDDMADDYEEDFDSEGPESGAGSPTKPPAPPTAPHCTALPSTHPTSASGNPASTRTAGGGGSGGGISRRAVAALRAQRQANLTKKDLHILQESIAELVGMPWKKRLWQPEGSCQAAGEDAGAAVASDSEEVEEEQGEPEEGYALLVDSVSDCVVKSSDSSDCGSLVDVVSPAAPAPTAAQQPVEMVAAAGQQPALRPLSALQQRQSSAGGLQHAAAVHAACKGAIQAPASAREICQLRSAVESENLAALQTAAAATGPHSRLAPHEQPPCEDAPAAASKAGVRQSQPSCTLSAAHPPHSHRGGSIPPQGVGTTAAAAARHKPLDGIGGAPLPSHAEPRGGVAAARAPAVDGAGLMCKLQQRLQHLDLEKQEYILQVMDKLEVAQAQGVDLAAIFERLAASVNPSANAAQPSPPCTGADAPSSMAQDASLARGPYEPSGQQMDGRQLLRLRLLEPHDGGASIGLTEIELFDAHGGRIDLLPEDIQQHGCAERKVARLVTSRTFTTNKRHMWLAERPPSGTVEVQVRIPAAAPRPAWVRLWNYNHSAASVLRGVKQMQVVLDGVLLWKGEVDAASASAAIDYSSLIPLQPGASPPPKPQPTMPPQSQPAPAPPLPANPAPQQDPQTAVPSGAERASAGSQLTDAQLLEELHRRGLASRAAAKSEDAAARRDSPGSPQRADAVKGHDAEQRDSNASSLAAPQQHPPPPPPPPPQQQQQLQEQPGTAEARAAAPDGSSGVSSLLGPRVAMPAYGRRAAAAGAGAADPTSLCGCAAAADADAEPDAGGAATLDSQRSGAGRRRRRRPAALTVEQSLDSLAAFSRRQAGRLKTDTQPSDADGHLQLEASFRDALDFLSRAKEHVLSSAAASPTPPAASAPQAISAVEAACPPAAHPSPADGEMLETAVRASENAAAVLHEPEADNSLQSPAATAGPAPRAAANGDLLQAALASGRFVVPSEPRGSRLEMLILSTWGDPHYVGLTGLEVFDSRGEALSVADPDAQISAEPHSINDLAEYSDDPRTPEKLLDGVNATCSDLHAWMAPYSPGKVHLVSLQLEEPASLGMVRLWNYNKSRIHATRGARHIVLLLDGVPIFMGEVARAPGNAADARAHAECILFTDNAAALQRIDERDLQHRDSAPAAQTAASAARPSTPPGAAEKADDDCEVLLLNELEHGPGRPAAPPQPSVAGSAGADPRGRPHTSAVHKPPPEPAAAAGDGPAVPGCECVEGHTLTLEILSTWGDKHYVGLTALEVLGGDGRQLALGSDCISADPPDLNCIPGCSGDDRTVDKLLDGVANTSDCSHMWLAPCRSAALRSTAGAGAGAPDPTLCRVRLQLALPSAPRVAVSGLRIWNYNKALDDTARGAQVVRLLVDSREVSPPSGLLVAKAPGTSLCAFGQTVPIPHPCAGKPELAGVSGRKAIWMENMPQPDAAAKQLQDALQRRNHNTAVRQDWLTPLLPLGHLLKLVLWDTWGDAHFCGLSSLEVHDAVHGAVAIAPCDISALPCGVHELPGMAGDVRQPSNLVDGVHSGERAHCWLAPRPPPDGVGCIPNVVLARLPHLVMLSQIRIWNYSHTLPRGAKSVDIYLDDSLIYKGFLRQAATRGEPSQPQTILFSNDPRLLAEAKPTVYCHLAEPHQSNKLVLVNEGRFESDAPRASDPSAPPRPQTAVVLT